MISTSAIISGFRLWFWTLLFAGTLATIKAEVLYERELTEEEKNRYEIGGSRRYFELKITPDELKNEINKAIEDVKIGRAHV